MSDENNKQHRINFALVNIKTEKLDIHPDAFEDGKPVAIQAGINFGIDKQKHLVKTVFNHNFVHPEEEQDGQKKAKPIIELTISCVFAFDPESWQILEKEEEQIFILPKGLASHFAMMTAGTARGILHNETEHTEYNKLIIPAQSVGDIIPNDVQISLSQPPTA
ncbi:MAG: hypothetical protein MI684_06240 [Chlorobiales bacterium]|nr:hypothetical protein [Chlorobiales bacterium]